MLTIVKEFGATPSRGAKRVDATGQTRSPGETLDKYPWERAVALRNVVAALKGRSYPAPIPMGPVMLGRDMAAKANMLMALARHGQPEQKSATASVQDIITWMRQGNAEVDVKRAVADRMARIRSVDRNVIHVGAQTMADYVRAKAEATVAAARAIAMAR